VGDIWLRKHPEHINLIVYIRIDCL